MTDLIFLAVQDESDPFDESAIRIFTDLPDSMFIDAGRVLLGLYGWMLDD